MTPVEEQVLRNQLSIMSMLASIQLLLYGDDEHSIQFKSTFSVSSRVSETKTLLALECEHGQTTHGYS